MRAHDNGKIPRNPFSQFHISPNCKEREYLTEDELKQVMTHHFEDVKLAFVRDIFVFVSFTALSFVDVKVIGLPLRSSKNYTLYTINFKAQLDTSRKVMTNWDYT